MDFQGRISLDANSKLIGDLSKVSPSYLIFQNGGEKFLDKINFIEHRNWLLSKRAIILSSPQLENPIVNSVNPDRYTQLIHVMDLDLPEFTINSLAPDERANVLNQQDFAIEIQSTHAGGTSLNIGTDTFAFINESELSFVGGVTNKIFLPEGKFVRIEGNFSAGINKHLLKKPIIEDQAPTTSAVVQVVSSYTANVAIEIKKDAQVLIADGISENVVFTWENGRIAGNPIKIFLRDNGTSRGVVVPNVTQLGNQISLNVTMPIATIPSEWHALDLVPLDNAASSVLMTSYVTESGEFLREVTESHDLGSTINPVIINVKRNTTILYLENIKTNVSLNFGTEFPDKEIKVFLKGTAGNTVTFLDASYKGWNNDYFNSNVFTLDEEKSLSVDVYCYLSTLSIRDWMCEGKTVIFTQPIKRAYYSEQLGNDSKAKLNDPNKPFATHTAAFAAIGTLGANERAVLEILPSYIDNTIDLANNIDIHFQPGCVIRLGSIRDTVFTGKNISITGFPKVSTSASLKKVFEFTSDITVRIQLDSVPYCDSLLFMSGSTNVKMTTIGDIYGNAQDAGYVITYRDTSKLDLNVAGGTGSITGNFFAPLFGRGGTTPSCSANVVVRAKSITTLTGTSGSYQTVVSHNNLVNANILIAADLEYKGSIFFTDRTAVLSLTNTNDANSKVRVEGKITAGVAYGIGTVAANGAFNIEVDMQGKESSSNIQFMATWQGTTDNPNGKILLSNGGYREGLPSVIGRRRKVKLKNIGHINTAAANPTTPSDVFICQANTGANKTSVYLDESTFFTNDGNASKLISGNTSTLGVELTCSRSTGTAQVGANPDRNSPDGYNELRYSASEF
ncbi:MAG: hypothetical protein VKN72_11845 [Nostocales cyanobacterium 94392]|nr:hypothetical protein [Nostocales cyanobacterium 94392]